MKLKVLGSSSKGNCCILETETGSLLLDAGVPFLQIQKALDFDLSNVRGCLITHEHKDHSKAIKDVMKAGIDVYAPTSCSSLMEAGRIHRFYKIKPGSQFSVGDFIVLPIEAQHDVECLAYLMQYRPTGERVLYATDTYYLKNKFVGLNYIMIECNYCPDILKANIEAGLIPESLKNRLLESHFSLENVKGFLAANDLTKVRKVILCHLSDGNSDAARMVQEIHELTGKDVEVAEPGKEIELEMCPF
jgi:phosphoribosyl 1,2-cyclic phosphodiesterase